jgi:hypothetical protein
MLDPAAMGTLLIGLHGDQAETASPRRRPAATDLRRRHAALVALATGLRRAAAWLDRPAVGEIANQP